MSNQGDTEDIEPEIRRLLTIPLMPELCDEELEGTLTEEQLKKFKNEELRELLFHFSRLEKKINHTLEWLMITNRHQRQMEAQQIRRDSLKWKIIKWGSVTVLASSLGALGKKLMDWIKWP